MSSTNHRANQDQIRTIAKAWAEILPELPEHLTKYQRDSLWYRTYILATRNKAPSLQAIVAKVLTSPTPPQNPEHVTTVQPARTPEDAHHA